MAHLPCGQRGDLFLGDGGIIQRNQRCAWRTIPPFPRDAGQRHFGRAFFGRSKKPSWSMPSVAMPVTAGWG
jgi:hypothetical protein